MLPLSLWLSLNLHASFHRYGKRAADIIKRYKGVEEFVKLTFQEDQPVDPEQVAEILENDPSITDVWVTPAFTLYGTLISDHQQLWIFA